MPAHGGPQSARALRDLHCWLRVRRPCCLEPSPYMTITGPDDNRFDRLDPNVWIGQTVNVTMDRPVGSLHPKHGAVYPINYGYVPGIIGGDGEEIDVYVLGTNIPLESCQGEVIAVVRRYDDVEDKLVVRIDRQERSREHIAAAISFQECYYDSHVMFAGDLPRAQHDDSVTPTDPLSMDAPNPT